MNEPVERSRESGFGFGLLMGACVGAGVVMWLAPRVTAELRQRVDELTRKGQGIRDQVADAVAHGAHAVERAATAAKS
jgi:gas vesicle protein